MTIEQFLPAAAASLALLSPAARAQLVEGDLLVNVFNPGRLIHYRPDGTLVAQSSGGPGGQWQGAEITPDGGWVASVGSPRAAVFFDATGTFVSSSDLPQLMTSQGDVAVFSDGTLAVADSGAAKIELYGPMGHVGTIPVAGGWVWGLLVDANDHLWACDVDDHLIHHFLQDGTPLGSFSTGSFEPADIDMAPDGTLWSVGWNDGNVYQFAQDGTPLASISTPFGVQGVGIAVAADGTIWTSRYSSSQSSEILHYDSSGNLLGSIAAPLSTAFIRVMKGEIGAPYCSPAIPNSSGLPARLSVAGSTAVALNDIALTAEDLPIGEFGYFLVGSNQGQFMPPGSQGVLCLTCGFQGCSGIGRYNQAGQIIQGPVGTIPIDLGALPLSPAQAVQPGDTWNFQCWFRDLGSSNFTDAVAVTFH
ncbi:MAG: hypothetical protein GY711_31160 [bacterium]|nr:hypothetical protein [bacterium]